MANLDKYSLDAGGWTSALATSTDLDTKATGSVITIGANVPNGTNLMPMMDVSLQLGSFTPVGTPAYFECHLLPLQADGTSYADRTTKTLVDVIALLAGASVKNGGIVGISIPPGDFKLQLVSVAGATTAGSGNSFKYRLYTLTNNG